MIIYRIENYTGGGMYSSHGSCERKTFRNAIQENTELDIYELEQSIHPGPLSDKTLERKLRYSVYYIADCLFGFVSIKQLRRWTISDEIRAALHNYGYRVAVISVDYDYCIVSKYQAIYLPKGIKHIEYLSVLDF